MTMGTAAPQGGSHQRPTNSRAERQENAAVLWPDSTWSTIERVLGVAAPDAVLREEIRHAVAPYVAAPWLTDELYLDPDDVRRVHAAEVRACARTLAEPARSAAHLGAQLPLPRSKETRLTRTLVRHLLPDHPMIAAAPGRRPLEPEELALLAERARGFRYRARRGPGRNLALTELVRRLTRSSRSTTAAGPPPSAGTKFVRRRAGGCMRWWRYCSPGSRGSRTGRRAGCTTR
jgi:hypothetical protein